MPRGNGKPTLVSYPTPDLNDRLVAVVRAPDSASYENWVNAKGTPIEECGLEPGDIEPYAGFVLAKIVPDTETNTHTWYFLNERANEDAYNFTTKFQNEDPDFPVRTRSYLVLREDFASLPLTTSDPADASMTLVSQEQVRSENPTVDALFVAVQRVFMALPGPVLAGRKVTSEFGGGVVDTFRQNVAPGEEVVGGLRVVGAQVVPDSAGLAVKEVSALPDGDSWPELRDPEFIPELNLFVDTYKAVVANTNQAGSRTGGTGGNDLVVTEYRPIDKWKTIQVVSKFPFGSIGSSRTFKKVIQYTVPNSIPVEPTMVRAYSAKFNFPGADPGTVLAAAFQDSYTTDMELDYRVIQGYQGSFVADVTRTIDLAPSETAEYFWRPSAEQQNIPVSLNFYQSVGGGVRGKVIRLQTPAAIHGAWNVPVARVLTHLGVTVWKFETIDLLDISAGYPIDYDVGTPWAIDFPYYRIQARFDVETLAFTAPATTPSAIPYDVPIVAAVNSEPWRFGLWVNDVYRITIPSP